MKIKIALKIFFIGVVAMLVSCKTYNTVIHRNGGKEAPKVWDFDEPVTANVFNTGTTSLKKTCQGKEWETAKIYHQWFRGWMVSVKCKA